MTKTMTYVPQFGDPWRKSSAVPVAGIDFDNMPEDGGKSRQELLRALPDEPFAVQLDRCKYVRDGIPEDAIKVRADGNVIGWIPKELVPQYLGTKDMVAKTYKSSRRITCRLLPPSRPTRNQAYAIRSLMKDGCVQRSPLWDKNAITWTMNQLALAKA